jgi:acetoacetyl-CoA synthetase
MDDWAVYNGKTVDLRSKMREILSGMSHARNFTSLISMPRFSTPEDISLLPKTQTLAAFLFTATASPTLSFEHTAFRDPFLIAYSSGTTGVPKCIVHSCGGALISMAKEITLHKYMSPDDVCMQYTTTGWIMYLMNVVALLPGTRIVLYDGSPFIPNAKVLLQIAADQKVTRFGVSPRWMMQLQKENIVPQHEVDLSRLKMVMSTGMVLTDKQFDWFYDVAFPKEVHLANMSGGTDIVRPPLSPFPTLIIIQHSLFSFPS